MTKSTIDVTQQAANNHLDTARSWLKTAVRWAAASPYIAMRKWYLGTGVHDYETAEEQTKRVTQFNEQLSDCRSCIAFETADYSDDDDIIEAAAVHFDDLAKECSQYADDLRSILLRRF